jgi:alpha-mannosidase
MWKEQLRQAREKLLFNQFHDIAPGTSIHRVHEQAEKDLALVQQICGQLQESLLGRTAEATVVINTSSSPRMYWGTTIPAQGAISLGRKRQAAATAAQQDGLYILANEYMVCTLDRLGQVVSLRLAGQDKEFMAAPGNCLRMYHDVNTCYDAWELGSMYEQLPVELDGPVTVAMYQLSGKVELEINRTLNGSALSQYIILDADAKYLTFETEIHWKEKHKLLKVAFPVNALTNEAIHEIQFGHVKRPNHRSYRTDKDRYEVCNHRYTALCDGAHGAAVLNDSKYGVNVVDNEIRLTLLKSPMMPDQNADRGEQCFTYGFYPFDGAFADSDVARQATELNEPLLAGNVYDDLGPILLPNAKNVIVDTIKPADTVHNALLVRVYEAMGKQVDCNFTVNPGIKKIVETDMLEEDPRDVDASCMHFGSFEIKTLLLYF